MNETRCGKNDRLQLLIFPPALIVSFILIYQVYRWMVPPALSIENIEVVNVVQALNGLTPLRKNGILFHQSEPLSDGGSSRLLVVRGSDQGTHVLVQGRISHSFLGSKIPLDKMINLRITTNQMLVEADGEKVPFILLTPRTVPVQVELGSMPESAMPQERTPAQLTGLALAEDPNQRENNSGIEVALQASAQGGGGLFGGLGTVRFDVVFPDDATAWIELPRTLNLPSPAVGGEDLEVGFLIPLDAAASGRYAIRLFGDRVARLPRELFSDSAPAEEPPETEL